MKCPFSQPEEIQNIAQVVLLLIFWIKGESLNFHPDTPMEDYIDYSTGKCIYNEEQADTYNRLLARCFEICRLSGNIDIYRLTLQAMQETRQRHSGNPDQQL